ncbi:MAG: DMT family transporter [Acidobacteria bacterium]|nr:DMT family transporter [Acidobacteriota bacterium]
MILISPFVCAIANVLIKRYGQGVHPLSLTTPPMALAALVASVAALVWERDRALVLDAASVGALLYLAVAGSAVTFGLYYWLLAEHRATRVSLIAYGTPVVAVVVGQLWLQEPITPRILVGAALVIGGVAFATRR